MNALICVLAILMVAATGSALTSWLETQAPLAVRIRAVLERLIPDGGDA